MVTAFPSSRRGRGRRRALGLVEVLLAAVLLSMAGLPLLSLVQADTRQVHFNEFQLLARLRAQRIADAACTLDHAALLERSRSGEGAPKGLPESMRRLPDPLPAPAEELEAMGRSGAALSHLRALVGKTSSWDESAWVEGCEVGLSRLAVVVTWRLPTDPAGREPHRFVLHRLVARGDESLFQRNPFVREVE